MLARGRYANKCCIVESSARPCEVAAIVVQKPTELGIGLTKDVESMVVRSEDKRKHWQSLFTMIECQKNVSKKQRLSQFDHHFTAQSRWGGT